VTPPCGCDCGGSASVPPLPAPHHGPPDGPLPDPPRAATRTLLPYPQQLFTHATHPSSVTRATAGCALRAARSELRAPSCARRAASRRGHAPPLSGSPTAKGHTVTVSTAKGMARGARSPVRMGWGRGGGKGYRDAEPVGAQEGKVARRGARVYKPPPPSTWRRAGSKLEEAREKEPRRRSGRPAGLPTPGRGSGRRSEAGRSAPPLAAACGRAAVKRRPRRRRRRRRRRGPGRTRTRRLR
jgi:hypothetical protein